MKKKDKPPGGCFRVSILAIKCYLPSYVGIFFTRNKDPYISHNPNHGMVSMHLARDWEVHVDFSAIWKSSAEHWSDLANGKPLTIWGYKYLVGKGERFISWSFG